MKNLIHITVLAIGVLLALYIAEYEPSVSETAATNTNGPETASTDVFSEREICKAVISTVMGRSPAIMTAQRQADNVIVSYVRQSDNTTWRAKCSASSDEAVWGNADGRWRNHNMDLQITIGLTRQGHLSVSETYSDGSERTKTFSPSQLATN